MESMDRFCWSCGSGIYKNDRFCRKCASDLSQRQPIDQDHEAKPEAAYTPPTPIPEVAVKEVSTAPTSSFIYTSNSLLFKLFPGLWDMLNRTPTPTSTATAPSPKPDSLLFKLFPGLWDMLNRTPTPTSTATAPSPRPELKEAYTPPDSVTIALHIIGALGWLLAGLFFFMAVFSSLPNAIRTGGEYWATMNVLGSLLIGGTGVAAGIFCRRKIRRRKHG